MSSVLPAEILLQPGFLVKAFDISASAFDAEIFFCRIFVFHVKYIIYMAIIQTAVKPLASAIWIQFNVDSLVLVYLK